MENAIVCVAVELVDAAKEKAQEGAEKLQEGLEYLQTTVVPKLKVKIQGCLNRSNIFQAVRSALKKAGVKCQEDPIKIALQEMVDLEGAAVINVDVLDAMLGDIQAELEIECEQVATDLRPGDIIYEVS